MKSLAEAIAKTGLTNWVGRCSSIEFVAGGAVASIKAGEFDVRFQAVVSETNAQLIAGQLLTNGFKFGTVGEGASECSGNVRVGQVTERLGLVNHFDVDITDSTIPAGYHTLVESLLV